jgi:hypothetical protein
LVSSFSARFPVAHALFQIVLDSRRLGILFSCIQFTHLLDEWQKDRKQALSIPTQVDSATQLRHSCHYISLLFFSQLLL